MSKEIIHFAHANGFPAKTYTKLFSFLEDKFEINYLDRHAHNPIFPVTDGWQRLADELRGEIKRRYDQPIIGIGHSLGGILHFLVAVENPELYQANYFTRCADHQPFEQRGHQILKFTKKFDKFSAGQNDSFQKIALEKESRSV